ncbi:hypothetical protein CEP52_005374 [Fusarium oligoseptatum]|uniref:Integral membrane protein n=1 Tax=Fusarium oligoseptatum TaxID=2604345 RepID=A0A428TYI4_9HYPO|nr:hypothetical protein CEP52_005374 [Fusarium oligoseptatum]
MSNFPVVDGVSVLIPPPQGYVVNFGNPKQQCALAAYILWGSGTFVATLFFIQYLYVKLWLIRKWDVETVFVILAWVLGNIDNALLGCKCPTLLTCVLRLIQFIPTLYSLDATWDIAPTQLWIFPETSLLVICPCLTTLRRFLAHVAPTWIGAGSRHPYLTVGSAGKRKRFDQFGLTVDEPAFNMKPMAQGVTTEVVIEP